MKNGHPSREHSDGKKQAHEVRTEHDGHHPDMKRGVDHLKEHHREHEREVNRDHEKPHHGHAGHGELSHR